MLPGQVAAQAFGISLSLSSSAVLPALALLRDTEQAAFLRSEPLDKLGTGFASVSKDAAPGARSEP
jgi:hypothetical protein